MFKNHNRSYSILAALVLLNCSAVRAETGLEPHNRRSTLSISKIVSDLEKRRKVLSMELAAAHPDSIGKQGQPQDREKLMAKMMAKMMASGEMDQCLVARGSLNKTAVIPTDPYYRAFRKRMLAEIDIQAVKTWWKYCRGDSEYKSLSRLEELPLFEELKSVMEMAEKEMSSLSSAGATAESGAVPSSGGADLSPAIANRLGADKGSGGSVLDQIADWSNLSAEQKSQFITH